MVVVTATQWPEAFSTFFILGMAMLIVGVLSRARRLGGDPLTWSFLVLAAIGGWLLGSRFYMMSTGEWSDLAAGIAAPHTGAKNLLGGVAGGTLLLLAARRLLRIEGRIAEAFAVILPLAVAVGRIGCLLGGCCHGTPADVPWSVTYPAGTIPFAHQVEAGLTSAAAAHALPVHPVQIYEIAFLLMLAWVGSRAAARLRAPDSAFCAVAACYCAFRFFLSFARHGAEPAALGLQPVQLGLIPATLLLAAVVILREKRHRGAAPASPDARVEPRRVVLVGLLLAPLLATAAVFWLTPLERYVLGMAALPVAGHALAAAVARVAPALARGRLSVAAAHTGIGAVPLAALAMPLLLPAADAGARKDSFRIDVGGTSSAYHYQETCGETHFTDEAAGGSVSATYRHVTGSSPWSPLLDFGLKGYGSRVWRTEGPKGGPEGWTPDDDVLRPPFLVTEAATPYTLLGTELSLAVGWRWFCIAGGIHFFGVPELEQGLQLFPGGLVRIGAEDVVFGEISVYHGPYNPTTLPGYLAFGFGLGSLGTARIGATNEGAFVSTDLNFPLSQGRTLHLLPHAVIGGFHHDSNDENDDHRDGMWLFGLTLGLEKTLEP